MKFAIRIPRLSYPRDVPLMDVPGVIHRSEREARTRLAIARYLYRYSSRSRIPPPETEAPLRGITGRNGKLCAADCLRRACACVLLLLVHTDVVSSGESRENVALRDRGYRGTRKTRLVRLPLARYRSLHALARLGKRAEGTPRWKYYDRSNGARSMANGRLTDRSLQHPPLAFCPALLRRDRR